MQSDEFREKLAQVRGGNLATLDALLDSWRSIVRLHARGLLGQRLSARADSSDIVQETLVQAFQDFRKFRGQTEGEWMAWLRSILLVKASRLRRFHKADKRAVVREVDDVARHLADGTADPAMQSLLDERMAMIANAMEGLPTPMYEVIFRRIFLKQPFTEVAAALQRSPSATRVLWTRAIRKLREQLPAEQATQSDDGSPN